MPNKIPTYIIHLKSRIDRRKHILQEFSDRNEFDIRLVEPVSHPTGAISLWITIQHIIAELVDKETEFILLCEDDHQFTSAYSKEKLIECIEEAKYQKADILSGGVSGFTTCISVSKNIFWIENFSGLQFTVIFRKFFQTILDADFGKKDAADFKLCSLTEDKFFIYPFLSTQKDFGYSDVTPKNNVKGRIDMLYKESNGKVQLFQKVIAYYRRLNNKSKDTDLSGWDNFSIPTYSIPLSIIAEQKKITYRQFYGKNEFDLKNMNLYYNKILEQHIWEYITNIIRDAIKNDDDLIIICSDDHRFTEGYNKNYLLQNIIKAHQLGTDILVGGIDATGTIIPITQHLFWINYFYIFRFIILYKKLFYKILDIPFQKGDTISKLFSEMTSNKMAVYPFISKRSLIHNKDPNQEAEKTLTGSFFSLTEEKLKIIQKMYLRFG